ncbi:SRPBCC family protein [Microbacterium sp. PAMC22086]|nr:SRPBCC family protein [Microbacterium sp. PAMC22086]
MWALTQDPSSHVRWDARFSDIVPQRTRADGAQDFRYELDLRVHTIRGTGVSLATKQSRTGERTSALLFDTDDVLSPLGFGRGYWRYVPTDDGVRFLTGYDYVPGWGWLGRVLDPLITRRFVWWLTARSFDRLRLWAEQGIAPEETSGWRSLRRGHRPRARNCLSRPPRRTGRTIMEDAPESLEELV